MDTPEKTQLIKVSKPFSDHLEFIPGVFPIPDYYCGVCAILGIMKTQLLCTCGAVKAKVKG